MRFPDRVTAQVMNIGDWNDVVDMVDAVGEDYLRQILKNAEAGQLNERCRAGTSHPRVLSIHPSPDRFVLSVTPYSSAPQRSH